MATARNYDCWSCCPAECPDGFGKSLFGTSGLCPDATTAASPVILQLEITLDKATAIYPVGFDIDCLPDVFYAKFRSVTSAIGKSPCEYVYCNNFYKICYGSEYGDHEGFPTLRFNRNTFLKITDTNQYLYTIVPPTDSFGQMVSDPDCLPVSPDNFESQYPSNTLRAAIECSSTFYPITFSSDTLAYAYPHVSYSCSPFEVVYNGYLNVGAGVTVQCIYKITKATDCLTPYESVDPWWCTEAGCERSATEPSGAIGGPYNTRGHCLETCPTSTSYWCLYGQCVESASSPHVDADGPYASPAECSSACPGPAEMVYVCTPAGCGSTSKAYAAINSVTYYADLSTCQSNCDSEFYCTSYGCIEWWDAGATPLDATSGPYTDLSSCQSDCGDFEGSGYYCVDGSCQYYASRPVGAVGTKYSTDADCETYCAGSAGYYCVSNVCGYYTSTPPGATAGPYATLGLCVINCAPAPETVSPFPIEESDNNVQATAAKGQPKKELVGKNRLLERIKLPCIHRGERTNPGCGCGNKAAYKCAIFGECSLYGQIGDPKSIDENKRKTLAGCGNCKHYENPANKDG